MTTTPTPQEISNALTVGLSQFAASVQKEGASNDALAAAMLEAGIYFARKSPNRLTMAATLRAAAEILDRENAERTVN